MSQSGVIVARNSLWLIAQPIVISAVSVVATALVARHLGTQNYGLLLLLIAYFALFTLLANLGLRQHMVREIAGKVADVLDVVEENLWLRFALGCGAALLLVGAHSMLPGISGVDLTLVGLIAVQVVVHAVAVCFVDALYGLEKMRVAASIQAISGIVVQMLLLGAVWLQLDLSAFVLVYLLGSGILLAAGFWSFSRRAGVPRFHWGRRLRWGQVSRGWQMFLPGILESIRQRVAFFLLGGMLGSQAVGIFGAAQTLVQKLDVISDGTVTALFPRVASLHGRAGEELLRLVRGTFKVLLVLATPVACGLPFVAPGIVELLYGGSYAEAGPVLIILGASLPFAFAQLLLFYVLAGIREHNLMMYASIVGTVTGVGLLAGGVVLGGLTGAAMAFLLAAVVLTMLYTAICWWRLGAPFLLWDLARVVLANGFMVGALWVLGNLPMVITIATGAVVYAIAVFGLRLVTWTEILTVFKRRRENVG